MKRRLDLACLAAVRGFANLGTIPPSILDNDKDEGALVWSMIGSSEAKYCERMSSVSWLLRVVVVASWCADCLSDRVRAEVGERGWKVEVSCGQT